MAGIVLLGLGSCSEFIEASIADERVELLSPGAGAETTNYAMQFLWEPQERALYYRLQVASPTFDRPVLFYADTTLEKTAFSLSLEPGEYQWRVKAMNGSSETIYTTRSFTIHEGALSHQTVLQLSPADNFVTAQGRVVLSWQGIFAATSYRLQVDTNGFTDEKKLVLEREAEGAAFTVSLAEEARYQWRVRAENDTAQSRWSTVRSFAYDRTPPPAPVLTTPTNQAQENHPVTLRWEGATDAEAYLVYVYKSDSTLYSNRFPVRQEATAYLFNEGTRGEQILWRVRAVDRAGNESAYSSWRNFIIRN